MMNRLININKRKTIEQNKRSKQYKTKDNKRIKQDKGKQNKKTNTQCLNHLIDKRKNK